MSLAKAVNESGAPPLPTQVDPKAELDKAPKVLIRIHKTGDKNEQKQVYVGVNGIGYLIKRGEDVLVPEPVMRVLEDAVQTVYDYDDDAGALVKRDALAYPFTKLS
jgi:hypothetical protein